MEMLLDFNRGSLYFWGEESFLLITQRYAEGEPMFRYIMMSMIALSMTSFVSCSSKKKIVEDTGPEILNERPAEPLSFPELGSDSGQIVGLRTVTFAYDQASLSTTARQILAENANWIQAQTGVTVQVEGHCDNRGSIEYNLALGDRRAKSVRDYLVSLGVPPGRLSTISYGKEKPLDLSDSEAAFAVNRRANFVPLVQ